MVGGMIIWYVWPWLCQHGIKLSLLQRRKQLCHLVSSFLEFDFLASNLTLTLPEQVQAIGHLLYKVRKCQFCAYECVLFSSYEELKKTVEM